VFLESHILAIIAVVLIISELKEVEGFSSGIQIPPISNADAKELANRELNQFQKNYRWISRHCKESPDGFVFKDAGGKSVTESSASGYLRGIGVAAGEGCGDNPCSTNCTIIQ
jgi:hypothetical protein